MQSFGSIFFITYATDSAGETRIEWIGSALIWFLMALSVLNVALVVVLALRNRRRHILPEAFADRIGELAASGRQDEAARLVSAEASDFSRMLAAGMALRAQGLAPMVRTVEQASEELTVARFRAIETLNILGQVSPMIGLFGTVYGMIMAFLSIASSGGSADPVVLAGGIGTALVTTFWGLLIAIPALAAYAGIRNKVDALATEATRRAEEALAHFAVDEHGADAGQVADPRILRGAGPDAGAGSSATARIGASGAPPELRSEP